MRKLNEKETARILRNYKIPLPKAGLAKGKEEVLAIARKIGFPVVMKITSKTILHKTDVGGVKLNLKNLKEVARAYDNLIKISRIDGISVQKMYEGHKVIIGMKRDSQFGPVIAFGLGGIFVEVIKDVSLRIAPLTKSLCQEMIKEIKSYPILAGARGTEKVNMNKLIEILMKVSSLAMKHPEIKELDFNPVIVNKKEAVVVDARLIKE